MSRPTVKIDTDKLHDAIYIHALNGYSLQEEKEFKFNLSKACKDVTIEYNETFREKDGSTLGKTTLYKYVTLKNRNWDKSKIEHLQIVLGVDDLIVEPDLPTVSTPKSDESIASVDISILKDKSDIHNITPVEDIFFIEDFTLIEVTTSIEDIITFENAPICMNLDIDKNAIRNNSMDYEHKGILYTLLSLFFLMNVILIINNFHPIDLEYALSSMLCFSTGLVAWFILDRKLLKNKILLCSNAFLVACIVGLPLLKAIL